MDQMICVDDKVVNEIMNYGYVLTNLDKYHDNGEITEQLCLICIVK